MAFFQDIGTDLDNIFQLIEDAGSSDMVNQLAGVVTVWITITIMIKGYQALAGKATDPIRDVVWDIFIKMCIMVFVLNIGGYLILVTDAMNDIHTWAGGGDALYSKLDDLLDKTRELADMVWDKGNMASGAIAMVLVYFGFGIAVLPGLIVIVVTQFVLKLVLMLAPFMFFALLFGWLKNMFSQWLSVFFSNVLTVLIVTMLFSALISAFEGFIDLFSTNSSISNDVVYIGAKVLLAGIIYSALIGVAKSVAEKIATVGLESAMQGALGNALKNSARGGMGAVRGGVAGYNLAKNKVKQWGSK